MRNICFVDTGCWIALLNKDDHLHHVADSAYKRFMKSGGHFITTTDVLTEVANALCQPKFRNAVVEFYRRLQKSSRVKIIFVGEQLWESGWHLYETRLDKEWSLTDCISIVVMQEQGLRDVLTYDKHFVQAGFRAILRDIE